MGVVSGLIVWVAIVILTGVFPLLIHGYVSAVFFSILSMAACQVACSFLLGVWFRLSHEQAILLVKYVSALFVLLAAFAVYNFAIYVVARPMFADPDSSVILLVGLMNALFIGLVGIANKHLARRTKEWFRIKYISGNASLEQAAKSLERAKQAIAKNDHRGASKAFHSAAIGHVNHEMWHDAAEEYKMAADSLVKGGSTVLRTTVSWLYLLSSLARILNMESEKAVTTIALSRETIAEEKTEKKAKERILLVLDFLSAIADKDVKQSAEIWQTLGKRIGKWGYPAVEETLVLLEKIPALMKRAQ
jgi:hypothetical protein